MIYTLYKIYKTLSIQLVILFLGMHKKSIEAAETLKDEDDCTSERLDVTDVTITSQDHMPSHNMTSHEISSLEQRMGGVGGDFRTESIANLRAKAQTYSAQLRESVVYGDGMERHPKELCSSFDTPSSNENEDSDTLLDPTD